MYVKFCEQINLCTRMVFYWRLDNLKEVHRRHEQDLERLEQELRQTVKELDEGEIRTPHFAQRFRYYQELRGYVTDLVECLDEKVGWYAVTFDLCALGFIIQVCGWQRFFSPSKVPAILTNLDFTFYLIQCYLRLLFQISQIPIQNNSIIRWTDKIIAFFITTLVYILRLASAK